MLTKIEKIHNLYDKQLNETLIEDLASIESLVDRQLSVLRVPRALLISDLVNFATDKRFKEPIN